MTSEQAVLELADSTARAVAEVLETFCGERVQTGPAAVVDGEALLGAMALPAVGATVSYVDGVTGGNIFAITPAGARVLAAAMMGMGPDEVEAEGGGELSELELSAVGEAMNQMMAAAAAGTSRVLGQEVEISPPEIATIATPEDARALLEPVPHVTSVTLTVFEEPCRLVQLVPNAFTVRMTRALEDISEEEAAHTGPLGPAPGDPDAGPASVLGGVPLRVSVEVGRARMPMGRAVGLPLGAVVALDHDPDDPVDVLVNGRPFASGRLVLVGDGEWAVRIDRILATT